MPTILIVDDSIHLHNQMTVYLQGGGYKKLLFVTSAEEAYSSLGVGDQKKGTKKEIDLILMDIGLPLDDGIEACRKIKKEKKYRDIPIIMVTANTEAERLEAAFKAGAVDYINKPLNKIEILARIGSVIKMKHEMDQRKTREKELEKSRDEQKRLVVMLEEANEKLAKTSATDKLTDIANRRVFDDFLDKEWRRGQRHSSPVSLVMIDIDYFKSYNDTYGHTGGDECLQAVAKALCNSVERVGDLVARYGGEEFVAVLGNTGINEAVQLAETFRKNVAALSVEHKTSKTGEFLSISLGVATIIPEQDWQPLMLIKAADEALYQAKAEGRDRVCLYNQKK